MRLQALCLVIVAGLIAGCARQPVQPDADYQLQRMQQWYRQSHWQLEGRLGVVSEQDSFSASVTWVHEPGRDTIDLAGPLGQGRVILIVTDAEVMVDDGEQVRIYREGLDALLRRELGADVPVKALPYWLLGVVQPGVDYRESGQGFEQHGWRVIYRQLQPVRGGWLPRKISMEKQNNKLKLVVDQWVIS